LGGNWAGLQRGLTHLTQWLKLQAGKQMIRRNQRCALLDLMTCYHGLDVVDKVARANFKLVQVGQGMVAADCLPPRGSRGHSWIVPVDETIFGFEKPHVFINLDIAVSGLYRITGLSSDERAQMR
jgi:hypothetical protein